MVHDDFQELERFISVKGLVAPNGYVEGVDGGTADGEGDAIGGGDGDGPGTASGSITILRASELRWKRAPNPTYPDAARELNLPETACKAVITFDEQGTPYEVTFPACPRVFQEAARTAILNSRMYPQKRAGVAIKGRFTLNLVFKLR
jgi:outer membrane biosynthesis protein TonB